MRLSRKLPDIDMPETLQKCNSRMNFFGTDGIRGEAYKTLPLIRSYQLGYALREIFKENKVVMDMIRESSLNFPLCSSSGLKSRY